MAVKNFFVFVKKRKADAVTTVKTAYGSAASRDPVVSYWREPERSVVEPTPASVHRVINIQTLAVETLLRRKISASVKTLRVRRAYVRQRIVPWRQVRQTQNVDVCVDVESHPVGFSTPLNQAIIVTKTSRMFSPETEIRPVCQIEGESFVVFCKMLKKRTCRVTATSTSARTSKMSCLPNLHAY